DDRGQPESEIARRRFQRGDGFRVAGPRSDDQIFDRESRDLRGDRLRFPQIPSEVTRERSQIRYVGFPAARRAARAARAVNAQRDMTELSGDVVMPTQHLAVDDDAHADAVGNADEDQITYAP